MKTAVKIAIALGIIGVLAIKSEFALAQSNIVPDGTLGAESSSVIQNFNGLPAEVIQGGATRGANLFHSFQEFNVSAGREAYFFSPATIQNILARVTGNNPSEILGTLGTLGQSNPNLFLINPNGIIFGQNARLDVGGSFVGSTASAVTFPNGVEFSATNPQAPPLLTVSVPLGLQYGSNPGSVSVQRSILEVPNGQTLALVGGDVSLDGAFLAALGGRVELGGVAGTGTVGLNGDSSNLSLSFSGVALADISLTNASSVFVTAGGGGSIAINAFDLTMAGSGLLAGIPSGLGSTNAIAGNIDINATGAINLTDGSLILNSVARGAKGQGGDINITTVQLRVSDGVSVSTTTSGEGDGGNLTVNASSGVQLLSTSADGEYRSGLFAQANRGASGNAGDLTINTATLLVRDGAQVSAGTSGEGDGGNLTVNASQDVEVIGTSADGEYRSGLEASAQPSSSGKAGDLTINTATLLVQDGAQVGAGTFGEGNGGNLTVNASQDVEVIGRSADGRASSVLGASAQPSSSGKAGDLRINTGTLLVRDGAQVSAGTFGKGDGGNLTVNASQEVQLIGTSADGQSISVLSAQAASGSSGKAGDLTINTTTLLVRDGAQIGADTFGEGDGGNLTVNASQEVQLIGRSADGRASSALSAQANRGASGNAGDLTINTATLLVRDGAQVSAGTFGEGNGGNLTVNASQGVQLIATSADSQFISGLGASASSGSSGKAGDLTINTATLLVQDGAQVGAGTFGKGDGGNLTVNASQEVQLIGTSADGRVGSVLSAQANPGSSGKAGDLTINTARLLVQDGAQVGAATFGNGKGGSLTVKASDSVQLSGAGSGLVVNAIAGSTAGNLTVETRQMSVSDGAQVTVSSPQGQAGNMTIQANSLRLNQGTLSAETAKSSPEGGANIRLSGLDLLRMDNESLISANAFDQANGGNVTIASTFIVATPPTGSRGSGITANAQKGNGGAVNITTQGLFGIEFRPRLTPKNDITVSSQFGLNGTFQLNTPGVDPSRGLTNLPSETIDASGQIDQTCQPGGAAVRKENKFIITGRGGLPPSPNEPLQGESVITNWVTLDSDIETKNNTTPTAVTPSRSSPKQIVEAQGWIFNEKGQVVLTASSPTVTPQGQWLDSAQCNTLQSTGVPR